MPVEYPRKDDQSQYPTAAGFPPTREQRAGFNANVCEAISWIAPERTGELLHDLSNATPWKLEFNSLLDPKCDTLSKTGAHHEVARIDAMHRVEPGEDMLLKVRSAVRTFRANIYSAPQDYG